MDIDKIEKIIQSIKELEEINYEFSKEGNGWVKGDVEFNFAGNMYPRSIKVSFDRFNYHGVAMDSVFSEINNEINRIMKSKLPLIIDFYKKELAKQLKGSI